MSVRILLKIVHYVVSRIKEKMVRRQLLFRKLSDCWWNYFLEFTKINQLYFNFVVIYIIHPVWLDLMKPDVGMSTVGTPFLNQGIGMCIGEHKRKTILPIFITPPKRPSMVLIESRYIQSNPPWHTWSNVVVSLYFASKSTIVNYIK